MATREETLKSVTADSLGKTFPPPPMSMPARIGRYEVQKVLGEGAFGRVFLAQDDQLKRPVAIKVPYRHRLAPQEAARYLEEARVLAGLEEHPGIVPIYDFGRTAEEGLPFVVSRYLPGGNLAGWMKAGRLSPPEAAQLVADIAEALHHAHRRGIYHRDIKPANILLDGAGKAYLGDFGLALREEDFGTGPQIVGTLAYMSPEQARGQGHQVTGQSDIYSLGVVFYELLTGRLPFRGGAPKDFEEVRAQLTADLPPLAPRAIEDGIPAELERICLKALAKRPEERFSVCRDLAEELHAYETSKRLPAGKEQAAKLGCMPWAQWALALAGLFLLVGVIFALYQWFSGPGWENPKLISGNGNGPTVKEPNKKYPFLLSKKNNCWQVKGGGLHGLTRNSILAVYYPEGQAGAGQLAGHVKVISVEALRASVEPCAFGKAPRIQQLPEGGRCQPVYIDFGDLRLRLAVDPAGLAMVPINKDLLPKLAQEKGSLVQVVDPAKADWLWRASKEGIYFIPAAPPVLPKRGQRVVPLGPFSAGPDAEPKIREAFQHIARVENLRRLAQTFRRDFLGRPDRLQVKVELLKFATRQDAKGVVVPDAPELSFQGGDILAFRITNLSGKKLHVTLLYLGADFEIRPLHPEDEPEPLEPQGSIQTRRMQVQSPWGRESLLVIGVLARGQAIDFTCLAQPSLEEARSRERGQHALDSPLGQLLQNACFGEGTRGLVALDIDDYLLELRSWLALPPN